MKLLLDPHAVVWWILEPRRLSEPVRALLDAQSVPVLVSVASAWEIAIKVGKGKRPEAEWLLETFDQQLKLEAFELLPISIAHVRLVGLMQTPHSDPFDRLLAHKLGWTG